jgi:hypothetical protein
MTDLAQTLWAQFHATNGFMVSASSFWLSPFLMITQMLVMHGTNQVDHGPLMWNYGQSAMGFAASNYNWFSGNQAITSLYSWYHFAWTYGAGLYRFSASCVQV